MTKIIDINLGQIHDMKNECISGGAVSNDLDDLQSLLSDTQKLIGLGSGMAYRKLEELMEEIDDNVRGIANNVEDLGKGCEKYYNRMIDLGKPVTSYDENMMVSDELGDVKKNYKSGGYQSDLKDAKRIASTVNDNVHLSLGSGMIVDHAKLKSFNATVETYCDRIKNTFDQIDYSIELVYDKLEDVEDFKSHEYNEAVNIGAKIVVATGIAVATTVVAAALLPEAACVAAVIATEAALTAAGTAVVSSAKHYHNGSDIKESAVEGTVDGVKAGTSSAVFGGLGKVKSNGKAVKAGKSTLSNKEVFSSKAYISNDIDVAERLSEKVNKGNFGITKEQKKYVISSAKTSFKKKAKKEIGNEVISSELESISSDIDVTELYEEVEQVLEKLNINIGGDDIWENI